LEVTWVLTGDVLHDNWMGLEYFIYLITIAIRHIIENNLALKERAAKANAKTSRIVKLYRCWGELDVFYTEEAFKETMLKKDSRTWTTRASAYLYYSRLKRVA
jgi:hypothetical protein